VPIGCATTWYKLFALGCAAISHRLCNYMVSATCAAIWCRLVVQIYGVSWLCNYMISVVQLYGVRCAAM